MGNSCSGMPTWSHSRTALRRVELGTNNIKQGNRYKRLGNRDYKPEARDQILWTKYMRLDITDACNQRQGDKDKNQTCGLLDLTLSALP